VVEEAEAKRLILDEIGQALRRVKEKRDAVVGFLAHGGTHRIENLEHVRWDCHKMIHKPERAQ
jgi:hypothetical protein